MIGGNTANFVLKRMQGHFLTILPPKNILEFQDSKKRLRTRT